MEPSIYVIEAGADRAPIDISFDIHVDMGIPRGNSSLLTKPEGDSDAAEIAVSDVPRISLKWDFNLDFDFVRSLQRYGLDWVYKDILSQQLDPVDEGRKREL